MIKCPNCGSITKDEIVVYNESLRRQKFGISPVLPTCKQCNAEVVITHKCDGGNIIILNGTCGSGKSTIAEMLAEKGYFAIDGDCVIQTVRHKKGTKQYEWDDLIREIACEIDIVSLFGRNIVLSHIVMPEEMDTYMEMFQSRNLNFNFFLLKPEYPTAVERCQSRTCHTSITPEQWVKHFYDILNFDDPVTIVDNTHMTAEETTQYILQLSSRVSGQG